MSWVMKQAIAMLEGGWAIHVWPNEEYTRYTAVFMSDGDDCHTGHGKTPEAAIKSALRAFDGIADFHR